MSATSKKDRDYLDGLLEAFDDLPDGAWAYACQAAIAEDRRFNNRDPYDVWIDWVERKSKEQFPPAAAQNDDKQGVR
jgi:hypothetical protein